MTMEDKLSIMMERVKKPRERFPSEGCPSEFVEIQKNEKDKEITLLELLQSRLLELQEQLEKQKSITRQLESQLSPRWLQNYMMKKFSNKRKTKLQDTSDGNFNEEDSEVTTTNSECGLNNFKVLKRMKGETKSPNVEFVPTLFRNVYKKVVIHGLELYTKKSLEKSTCKSTK